MKKIQTPLFFLRVTLGWLFLYAGATKIFTPSWSAEGYLRSAKTFSGFFNTLAGPNFLPIVNFVNEWGLFLLGVSLILGVCVKLSGYLGALLMILYYLPALSFPYIGKNYMLVDDHIIFAIVLILLATADAGRYLGLEAQCVKLPVIGKFWKVKT